MSTRRSFGYFLGRPRVFICYRRADAALARLLSDSVVRRLGASRVFWDITGEHGGIKFRPRIYKALEGSDVVLALIGPAWNPARLHNVGDFVADELRTSERFGKKVIPVAGAALPTAGELPDDLRWILDLHARELTTGADYESQMKRLLFDLGYRRWRPLALLATVLAAIGIGLLIAHWASADPSSAPTTAGTSTTTGSSTSTSLPSETTSSVVEGTTVPTITTAAPRTVPTQPPHTTATQPPQELRSVPTLKGREATEAIADLIARDLVPFPEVEMDGHYKYIVVEASEEPGTQVPVSTNITLTVDFDATQLNFPVLTLPGGGPVLNPTCSGGKYTIPEQKWSGVNVASVDLNVTPAPSITPTPTRAATSAGIGTFGGKTASFTVNCSNSSSVTVTLELTATGKQHVDGRPAEQIPKKFLITIDPTPVNG